MKSIVKYSDEFELWWSKLTEGEQDAVDRIVQVLESLGPTTPFPYSSGISNSKVGHMRELRIQYRGRPYRVLYAFDPLRQAILLLGGDKGGDKSWYDRFIPIAERIYFEHLKSLKGK